MRNDKDFRDGHMNREPHKREPMKKFVHGAKETIRPAMKTKKSPEQHAEAGRGEHRGRKPHEAKKPEHHREPKREVRKDEHRGEVRRMERRHHESPEKAGAKVREDKMAEKHKGAGGAHHHHHTHIHHHHHGEKK